MRPPLRSALVLLLLAGLGACASMRRPAAGAGDRNTITAAEMDIALHPNAFVLVRALRPHWLEIRGSGSLGSRMVKHVFLDDMMLGGVELLRQIATPSIESIEYFDGPAATQRWGTDHAAGVIQVRSRR